MTRALRTANVAMVCALVVAILGLGAQPASASPKVKNPRALAALIGKKLNGQCADYRPKPTTGTVDTPGPKSAQGECTIDGLPVALAVLRNHADLAAAVAMGGTIACALAKGFGITSIFVVLGNNWSIGTGDAARPIPAASMSRWAKRLGGSVVDLCHR